VLKARSPVGNQPKFFAFAGPYSGVLALIKNNGFLVVVAIVCLGLIGIGSIVAHLGK
jgi:hypothetical protein